jgi:hypothetical protein
MPVMKKFIVAILAVLYLATSSGAIVHFHYCMGKLTGWSLTGSKDDRCANCGMKKNGKNCCNEEHKLIKVSDDQKVSQEAFQLSQLSAILTHQYTGLPDPLFYPVAEKSPLAHAPPRSGTIAIYLRNCDFRI